MKGDGLMGFETKDIHFWTIDIDIYRLKFLGLDRLRFA